MALNSIGTLENSNDIFGFWVKCSLEEGTGLFGLAFSASRKERCP